MDEHVSRSEYGSKQCAVAVRQIYINLTIIIVCANVTNFNEIDMFIEQFIANDQLNGMGKRAKLPI